ncbi:hypothetical protein SNE40_015683 [Patella caerulea]|uniref:Transmembrane protein 26 n=1 Tax=Patella caerulea TaxID=87958 RepID=A0AAN8JKE8_PATCE
MGCIKKTLRFIGIIKAIISRFLFAGHGFICIWRVTVIKENPIWWSLAGTLPLLFVEAIYTLKKKKGGEWKWVCPSVFLYLATAIPAIWFLELDLLNQRITLESGRSKIIRQPGGKAKVWNGELNLPINLVPDDWCKILEQMLLLVLIVGRWLLPKGEISREQLSQLLLVYIGMAADIIELFEAFKEREVKTNTILTIIIMSLWTASLLQFTFVLTATKSKRMRPVLFHEASNASAISVGGKSCCPTEVISIMISVTLQDGPFLVLRMLLIFRYNVISYTNLFFTSKNSLVLILQFYRLFVLFCQPPEQPTTLIIANDTDDEDDEEGEEENEGFGEDEDDELSVPSLPKPVDLSELEKGTSDDQPNNKKQSVKRQNSIGSAKPISKKSPKPKDKDITKHQNSESGIEDDAVSSGSEIVNSTKSPRKVKGKRSEQAKQNWKNVKKMSSAISFVNGAGNSKYRTVVLNPKEKGAVRYVVGKQKQGKKLGPKKKPGKS